MTIEQIQSWSPEEKRQVIATALGFIDITESGENGINPQGWESPIPDYPRDLNAMHQAEHHLTKTQANTYGALLRLPREDVNKGGYGWHATAEQRATAWIATVVADLAPRIKQQQNNQADRPQVRSSDCSAKLKQ